MPSKQFVGSTFAELHSAYETWEQAEIVAARNSGQIFTWTSRNFEGRTTPMVLTIDYQIREPDA